mgnify:CR=1 FL=1
MVILAFHIDISARCVLFCRRGDDMLIDYALLTGSSYLIYKAVEKLDPAELLVNKLLSYKYIFDKIHAST